VKSFTSTDANSFQRSARCGSKPIAGSLIHQPTAGLKKMEPKVGSHWRTGCRGNYLRATT